MLAVLIVIAGVVSRCIPHQPNFTPVIALSLFGAAYLPRRYALILPVLLMALSDVLIGGHEFMFFTWLSMGLIACWGLRLRQESGLWSVVFVSIGSSVLFFIITNFGYWLLMYPHDFEGFVRCYTLAIPFFRNTLLSALLYSVMLFEGYAWMAQRFRNSKHAHWFFPKAS